MEIQTLTYLMGMFIGSCFGFAVGHSRGFYMGVSGKKRDL